MFHFVHSRHINNQRYFFIIPIILLIFLSIFKSCQVVQFHRDAQYYIQSSILWPQGLVTFAGSLIGDRDLVVFFYHIFMKNFGYSIDTLSISLAVTYLVTGIFLVITIFKFKISNVMKLLISIITLLIAYILPIWSYPASDNLGAVALVGLWLLYIITIQTQNKWLIFFVFPVCVGIAIHIRTELLLFGLFAFIGIVLQFKSISYLKRLVFFLILFFCTQLGAFAVGKSWSLWVPVKKPNVYKGIFLAYHAFHFAAGKNGTNSSRLSHLLHLAPNEKIAFWEALGATYSKLGTVKSDELISKVALEALYQYPVPFLQKIVQIPLEELKLQISLTPWSEQEKAQRLILNDLDLVRQESQKKFGGDALFPVATLLLSSNSLLHNLRDFFPPIKVEIFFPFAYSFIFPIILLLLLIKLDKSIRVLLFPPVIYSLILFLLIILTEGPITRYFNGIMLLESVVFWVSLCTMSLETAKKWQITKHPPLHAPGNYM